MAGLRAAQKEMTRNLLLSTAKELFETKGYASTTVGDIATAAETTRVTFYAYFPSRSDLVRALLGELNGILERSDSPGHGSTAGKLVDAVREGTRGALTDWLHERSLQWDTIRPYVNIATEASAVDPELGGLVDTWFDEVVADLKEGLDQAGRFDPGGRQTRAALAFSQLHYVAQHWSEGHWGVDRAQVVAILAESWTGLLTNGAGE